MKSIQSQMARMEELWPELQVKEQYGTFCEWEGSLVVHDQAYKLNFIYQVPTAPEAFTITKVQPRIRVLDPPLELHEDYELGPLPHVWWVGGRDPCLCVFDPDANEWSPDDFLAETTVPWALRWLLFYEGWLVTGRWFGGGRDHEPAETKVRKRKSPGELADEEALKLLRKKLGVSA